MDSIATHCQPVEPIERIGPQDWIWLIRFAMRAITVLAGAKRDFARLSPKQILARNSVSGQADPELLRRIAYVLPRVAKRLPSRTDCLVQALAGQSWLAAEGIGSQIRFGVQPNGRQQFEAHAWLVCQNRILTGGDVAARYAPL